MRHLNPGLWILQRSLARLFVMALAAAAARTFAAPVMFVTQTPDFSDFTTIGSVFGNHRGSAGSAARGGHLYIRYDDGTLRNLTAEAGFGQTPQTLIAVRDPSIHWDGTKALFSMVVGGTTQNDTTPVYFQIYEVTGLAQGETVSIRKLAQDDNFNNISPVYGSDDRIIFTTDRPRNGDRMLYPQLDEYESAPTVTGIWSMAPDGSDLRQLDHAPSGDFRPIVDSFGRVVFSRWDHLQRDQQADADIYELIANRPTPYQSFTFESEESAAYHPLNPMDEIFPESRGLHPRNAPAPDPIWDADHDPTETPHTFNLFLPWMVNQDGTELETLNHIGRHELVGYINNSRTYLEYGFTTNPQITSFLAPVEDPTRPGFYYAIDAPEFSTHASGQVIGLFAPAGRNPDDIAAEYITHPVTRGYVDEGEEAPPEHVGLFRDVMARADGTVWASHSTDPRADRQVVADPGSPNPYPLSSRYHYSIRQLVEGPGGYRGPGPKLIPEGIAADISYFDNGRYRTVVYQGLMWELQPVEVAARPRPTAHTTPIADIERKVLREELGGDAGIAELRQYLEANALALVVSRDVTRRADRQQDYNLKIAWSEHQTAAPGETPKEIAWMQFMEGRQVRGYREPSRGRRVLARPMTQGLNPDQSGAPPGSVKLGDDGSMAAFVPARRALSWQTTEINGDPAVRERLWLTFQPGEIRTCTNCHGLNRVDVFGNETPQNEPQALRDLMRWWKTRDQSAVIQYLLGHNLEPTGLDSNTDGEIDIADHLAATLVP